MFKLPVLRLFVLAGGIMALPAGAVAQTSKPSSDESMQRTYDSEEERQRAMSASSLFDTVGAPLLRISAPIYLQLGLRDKLRNLGGSGGAGVAGFGGSGGSGGSGTGPGSGGGSAPGDGIGDGPGNPGAPPPGDGDSIVPPIEIDNPPPRQVPEPALLTLLIPGALLALRRRAQRR